VLNFGQSTAEFLAHHQNLRGKFAARTTHITSHHTLGPNPLLHVGYLKPGREAQDFIVPKRSSLIVLMQGTEVYTLGEISIKGLYQANTVFQAKVEARKKRNVTRSWDCLLWTGNASTGHGLLWWSARFI
jgi:hypothetical protein